MSELVDPALLLGTAAPTDGRDALADMLARQSRGDAQDARIRLGVVTAANRAAWTVSVLISGTTTAVAGIPVATTVAGAPPIGSTVVLAQTGGSYIVIGVRTIPNPSGYQNVFAGPWSASTPGPTTGQAMSLTSGVLRAVVSCSAYAVAQTGIIVIPYLDGVSKPGMTLSTNHTLSAHQTLNPSAFSAQIESGTHYIAFQQIAGTSDATDFGTISVVVTPS